LWNLQTGESIAILRKGTERIVNCGLSPDGATIFTDDQASIARFWNARTGAFQTELESRPNRYEVPASDINSSSKNEAFLLGNGRALTRRYSVTPDEGEFKGVFASVAFKGPAELWDTETGKVITQIDLPETAIKTLSFLGKSQWIYAIDGPAVAIFAAPDGKQVARLAFPAGQSVGAVVGSPSGRRMAVIVADSDSKRHSVKIWDTSNWQAEPLVTVLPDPNSGTEVPEFWSDDLLAVPQELFSVKVKWNICQIGHPRPIAEFTSEHCVPSPDRRYLCRDHYQIIDTHTWQLLPAPAGHKFHPAVAQFALDGRFVDSGTSLLDTFTEKSIEPLGPMGFATEFHHLRGYGLAAIVNGQFSAINVLQVPAAEHLNLPEDLLERWAQVAVRGEIAPDGTFVEWTEPQWEAKRQELAAMKVPDSKFPFPGYLAQNRFHWLQVKLAEADSNEEKLVLMQELMQRAEAVGDKAESDRWRIRKKWLEPQEQPSKQ
jgi:hypothetical protein